MIRAYYVEVWKSVPTSDPYHFMAWASGISASSHLKFPGSEDRAYGQYPSGYPMFLVLLSSATGASFLSLTEFLPILVGPLCVLPVFLGFRSITRDDLSLLAGTAIVVFSLAFIKYTSVSIPNMLGLFLFAFAFWISVGDRGSSKRYIAILVMVTLAVAKIHYLSLVCIGIVLAVVLSRKILIRVSGKEFDPRRLAFILIVAGVAGVLAWTAAYKLMLRLYGIDITMQPPPRLSIVLKLAGYPLVFGLIQTLALPLGIVALAKIYYDRTFKHRPTKISDPMLLFILWLVFFIFSSGFLNVEYYPFRFNCFLMIPLGLIALLGILLLEGYFQGWRITRPLAHLTLPAVIFIALLQPLAVSLIPVGGGETFLPWRQEYGQSEMPAIGRWIQENTLCTAQPAGRPDNLTRKQMIMADWVRSRAMRAFGSEDVHIHWWFFQGWYDLEQKPFEYRSLDVYAGSIEKALKILGGLNLRKVMVSTGEHYYYYKYLYVSDWIADVAKREFGLLADSSKLDEYNGSYVYLYRRLDPQQDKVLPRKEAHDIVAGYKRYALKPFDKLYSAPGVAVYYYTPLRG